MRQDGRSPLLDCTTNSNSGNILPTVAPLSTTSKHSRLAVETSGTKTKDQAHLQPVKEVHAHCQKPHYGRTPSQVSVDAENRRKTHVGPWRLGKTLGKGASGRVRLAKHERTGKFAAIKIISKAVNMAVTGSIHEAGYGISQAIEREIVIMKLIKHPNVMEIYDVWENKGELYLVLEYIPGGELFKYLTKKNRLEETEAIFYFRQIMSGIAYCHSFNICHRDLKPENLLLDKHGNIKIADFGMAALQPHGTLLKTACGSPHYAAPEVIEGVQYNGPSADIWSCGVILYVLLCGYHPFDDPNTFVLLERVTRGDYTIPSDLTTEATDLLRRMLENDVTKRITIRELWTHPLMRKYRSPENIDQELLQDPLQSVALSSSRKTPIHEADIDFEILTNLKALWHGQTEGSIINKILSREVSQEQIFYHLLLKYRTEHQDDVSMKQKSVIESPGLSYAKSSQKQCTARKLLAQSDIERLAANIKRGPGTGVLKEDFSSSAHLAKTVLENTNSHKRKAYRENVKPLDLRKGKTPREGGLRESCLDSRISSSPLYGRLNTEDRAGQTNNFVNQALLQTNLDCSRIHKLSDKANSHINAQDSDKQSSTTNSPFRITSAKTSRTSQPVASRTGPYESFSRVSLTSNTSSYVRKVPRRGYKRHVNFSRPAKGAKPTSQNRTMTSIEQTRYPDIQTKTSTVGSLSPSPSYEVYKDGQIQFLSSNSPRKASKQLSELMDAAFNQKSVARSKRPLTQPSPGPDCDVSLTKDSHNEILLFRENSDSTSRSSLNSSSSSVSTRREVKKDKWSKKIDKLPSMVQTSEPGENLVPTSTILVPEHLLDEVVTHVGKLLRQRQGSILCEEQSSKNPVPFFFSDSTPREHGNEYSSARLAPVCLERAASDYIPKKDRSRLSKKRVITAPLAPKRTIMLHNSPGPQTALSTSSYASPLSVKPLQFRACQTLRAVPPSSHSSQSNDKEMNRHDHRLTLHGQISRSKSGDKPCRRAGARDSTEPSWTTRSPGSKTQQSISNRIKGVWSKLKSTKEKPDLQTDNFIRGTPIGRHVYYEEDSLTEEENSWQDISDNESVTMQKGWLARIFSVKPLTRDICMKLPPVRARREITKLLYSWQSYGIGYVRRSNANNMVWSEVFPSTTLKIKPLIFRIRVLSYGNSRCDGYSVIKINQMQGSSTTFIKVVDEIMLYFTVKDLIIHDDADRKVMIDYCKMRRVY